MHGSHLVDAESIEGIRVLRVHVTDILEAEQAYQMRDEMISLVDDVDFEVLAIDFSEVNFMGSVGFLALMSLRRHLPGKRLVLCGLSANLTRVVVACRLITNDPAKPSVFEVADSIESIQA